MNITPKFNVGTVNRGVLIIAVVGLIGWVASSLSHPRQLLPPETASQRGNSPKPCAIVPAVELIPAPGLQTAGPGHYSTGGLV